jgi:hypothetical protein
MTRCLLIFFILLSFISCRSRKSPNCKKDLDKVPYVIRPSPSATSDSMKTDLEIFSKCGKLDSIDMELVKGTILGRVLIHTPKDRPVTYRVVLKSIDEFRASSDYTLFRQSTIILKTLEHKIVNIAEFEKDRILFERLGASEKDIEEFKAFLISNHISNMTYKAAFEKYAAVKAK